MDETETASSAAAYDEASYWSKLSRYAKKIGGATVETSLQMFYAAQDPRTPKWARNVIYGALGYLILPLDAIPDLLPGLGYVDDAGVITAALALVAVHISDETKEKAAKKMREWFGTK